MILNIEHDEDLKNDIQTARCNVRAYGKGYTKYGVSFPVIKNLKNIIHPRLPLEINSFNSYVDIYDFVELLSSYTSNNEIENQCKMAMNALNESIVAEKSFDYDPAHGLSIYFPDNEYAYNRYIFGGKKAPSEYEGLRFLRDTSWDEFLKAYLNI